MTEQQTLNAFDKSTWTPDERHYFEYIDRACADRLDESIGNGRVEHAAYIIYKFLTNATGRIRIFSGALSRTYRGVCVFGDDKIIKAMEKFLAQPDSWCRIVIANELDVGPNETARDHPIARAIEAMKHESRLRGLLEIRQAPPEGMEFLQKKSFDNHWMTMDDHAYRIETNLERAGAHVNFNHPKTTDALRRIFDVKMFGPGAELLRVSA